MYMFSIIIPTKDRPHKTMRAIQSVLEQRRNDVQIVVADNSDTDILREEIAILGNADIVYLRTGGLRADENWVAAAPHCAGKYYVYLLDREVFLPGTLDRFATLIEQYPEMPICWQEALPIGAPQEQQDACILTSEEVVVGLIQAACGVNNNIEMRSHTICYPAEIYKKILYKLNDRIITGQASDLAGPLQLMFLTTQCLYIPERIKRTSLSSSQTVRGMLFWEEALTNLQLTREETYNRVPIKFYFLLNHVLNGMLELCEKNGCRITLEGELLEQYFIHIYNGYMRAVQKYHFPACDFMKAFFIACTEHKMQQKKWFNEIFYYWNWPEYYNEE